MVSDRDDQRGGVASGLTALFIDWDNFAIGLRQEMPDRPADVGPILRWARRFGPLVVCRAYGEWRDAAERLAIYNAGVEVVYAPVLPLGGSLIARNGGGAKSLADTAMAVDVTELLSLIPSITTVVLATSDKDLIPVLRFAQRRGLRAVVVGSDRTAGALRDLADEFISYRQLVDSETGASPVSRPVTIPPVRFPRGPRIGAVAAPAGLATGAMAGATGPYGTGRVARAPALPPAGEVSVDGELETEAPVAGGTRRRRRGGRRRRAGTLVAAETAAAGADLAAEDTEAIEATEAEPEPRLEVLAPGVVPEEVPPVVAAGRADSADTEEVAPPAVEVAPAAAVHAPEAEARAEADETEPVAATAPPEAEPVPAPDRAERTGWERPPTAAPPAEVAPVTRPPAGRMPIVLPGEKLRRFSGLAAAPVAEIPGRAPAPEATAPEAEGVAEPVSGASVAPAAPVEHAEPAFVVSADTPAEMPAPAVERGVETEGEATKETPPATTAGRSRRRGRGRESATIQAAPPEPGTLEGAAASDAEAAPSGQMAASDATAEQPAPLGEVESPSVTDVSEEAPATPPAKATTAQVGNTARRGRRRGSRGR